MVDKACNIDYWGKKHGMIFLAPDSCSCLTGVKSADVSSQGLISRASQEISSSIQFI